MAIRVVDSCRLDYESDSEPPVAHQISLIMSDVERPARMFDARRGLLDERVARNNPRETTTTRKDALTPLVEPSDGLEPSTPSLPWRCSTD